MEASAGRVVFTVVVLVIVIGSIVYTAICARTIVASEGAEAELERELAHVVDAAAARLLAESSNAASVRTDRPTHLGRTSPSARRSGH